MKEKLCLLAGLCVATALALPTAAAAFERVLLTVPPDAVFVSPQVGTGNMMVSGSRLLETLAAMGYDASVCKDGCPVTLTLSNGTVYQAARVGADGTTSTSHVGFSFSEIQGATVQVDRGEDPLPQLPAGTTTLYVSPAGNDRNPGTQAQPLATIGRALRLVAAASKGNASGWRVLLLSGTYFLKATATLDAKFSGSPNAPFVIGAAPGATPVVSGARDLHPIWRDGPNGIKTAQVDGGFDEIFLDGARQVRARYPNYDPTIAIYNGFSADATSHDRIARWKNPTGGFLHAQHQSQWGGCTIALKARQLRVI